MPERKKVFVERCGRCGRRRIPGDSWGRITYSHGGLVTTRDICEECFFEVLEAIEKLDKEPHQ